jgi:molybdopterin converting factor small subunit
MNLKFLGWISSLAGKREMDLHLETPVQLKELLPFSLQGKNIIVVINNRPGSEESIVHDTDYVALLPIISGG